MEVRNIFNNAVKDDMVQRINKLTAESQPLWGKMNVAQMLAHVQVPIGVGLGKYTVRRTLMGRIFGPMAKKILYNDKPFKRNLPTDPSFAMISQQKDFKTEKQNLLKLLAEFKSDSLIDTPHPFFGKLTKDQWSIGTWKHLDHHLQQFGV
jgi:Protein of unknown function (DUF1569)